ncbi:gfo/Idh/MocA family oxidoreductase [Serratia inhibens]|uniref:Gfo/Idh/MocA family oxidoreductase n=1 Tax=Serratia inhibens TaxID=2338073 RepID=A0AA92X4M2_9GAMM|nr:Gfo/Idh/MocA family oxidoreductase [Serratia inhibens]RJF56029.1 gfo/Idh/MocA family oxidoreductase [Serratia inhibens]
MFPSVLPTPRNQPVASIPSLRWGIIGPGWIAERFVKSLKEQSRQRILAVASRSQEKADRFAATWGIPSAYGDVNDMLARDDLDAIYVATPHNHHFPDGCQVLRADKHVLIEKPFALNAREGVALQELAQLHGKLAMEAMWCDYLPKYDVIRQLLEDGVLGDVHTLLADHGEFFTPDHRIFNADLAGGPMMDLGSYLVSFSVLIGGAPQDIIARGEPAPGGINGQTSMLFTHDNGLHSVLNTTLFSNTPGGAVVAGRDATLTIDGQFYAPGHFSLTASQGGKTLHWEEPLTRYTQLFHQAEHFAWCVGQGVNDSTIRPLSQVLTTLKAMDEVRRQMGVVFNEER